MAGLIFNIEARDKFSNTLSKANTEIQKTGDVASQSTKKLNFDINDLSGGVGGLTSKITGMIPGIGLAVAAIGGLVAGIKQCVNAAKEAEVSQVRFETALELIGANTTTINYLNDYALKLQNISGVSDEVIKDAMALGSTMGIETTYLDKATKVAMDLSAALGINLDTAMRMLAKGTEGNLEQLNRYIPSLGKLNLEAMDTAEILDTVGDKVDGMAEKMGNTAVGSSNKLKEAFGDLKESIGKNFLPAITAINNILTDIINSINNIISKKSELPPGLFSTSGTYATPSPQPAPVPAPKPAPTNDDKNNTDSKKDNTKATKENTKAQLSSMEIYIKTFSNAYEEVDIMINNIKENMRGFGDAFEETTEIIEQMQEHYHTETPPSPYPEEPVTTTEASEELAQSFDYLGLASQALGVNLQGGLEGFLISILTQTKAFGMLNQVIQPAIEMADLVLVPVLNMLIPVLMQAYDLVKPLLPMVVVPLMVLGAAVSNLISGIINFSKLIYYIVTFQWGKISSIGGNYITMSQLNAMVQGTLGSIETFEPTGTTGVGTAGVGASYSAAPTYYVNIYFQTPALVGEQGIEEFAMQIKKIIELKLGRGL